MLGRVGWLGVGKSGLPRLVSRQSLGIGRGRVSAVWGEADETHARHMQEHEYHDTKDKESASEMAEELEC